MVITMEKKYFVLTSGTKSYKTYEDAEIAAKRQAVRPSGYGCEDTDIVIAETFAVAKRPIPTIEVVKL